MQLLTRSEAAPPRHPRLTLGLATSPAEVREVQKLRHQLFIEAMGLSLPRLGSGLDHDEYDEVCEHLVVRDELTCEVVGTYRVLGPSAARRIGAYYSEREFDLAELAELRPGMAEAGRACVHPDYRSGAVITLLWSGLAAFMAREKCRHLIGCASISLADGGNNAAAVCQSLQASHLAPEGCRVTPRTPFDRMVTLPHQEPWVPPLIKGYLRGGAWVGGAPALDLEFHTADLFMLLPLARLERRYARHYLRGEGAQ
jgi:putative hemolysin